MAHPLGSPFLFREVQSTRHTSFPRRDSRLGIRRDDGQFLDRVLTPLSLSVALQALSQRGEGPRGGPVR